VIECMIRAIRLAPWTTGLPRSKSAQSAAQRGGPVRARARRAMQKRKLSASRRVNHSMAQGYVLTQYFLHSAEEFRRRTRRPE